MLPNLNLISCNLSSSPSLLLIKPTNPRTSFQSIPKSQFAISKVSIYKTVINQRISLKPCNNLSVSAAFYPFKRPGFLQIYRSSFSIKNSENDVLKKSTTDESKLGNSGNNNGGDWTTSILLFGLWAGLMYYVFMLTPNQTPTRDIYFLEKLLNLRRDDGFEMNQVLVSLWYIMGLWPVVYSMLLLPSGRSSRSKVPVWPFLVLSCFGGAYVLLPYFVLWRPPPPPVEEAELEIWPFNFLESKLTAGISVAAGLGLIIYAGLAGGDAWREFYQYFRESKFIHATCLDFTLLSTFAPFWVYNDMTTRKWFDKGSWLLPFSLIPFVGPALYLVLRPPIPAVGLASITSNTNEKD
ncbi:hypothetical protein MKW98_022187 [Papaver atlanticum]|uniref:Cardiolipin synthase N-terminal domain-containing protein n=1 Tax=Papaver atlanticum TaxID=357466 RepID=A0AAD4T5N0_9MAGN|nr:hypothetical protein MKW98_022187 [Papaver atlanticum]